MAMATPASVPASSPSAVETALIVAAVEHLDLLGERLRPKYRPVAYVPSAAWDAIEALETLRPSLLLVGEPFAGTPRGALLISRARGAGVMVRLVPDADCQRLSRSHSHAGLPGRPLPVSYAGPRRERRIAAPADMSVIVAGRPARVVDLSPHGAQVVTASPLQPGHLVRLALEYDRLVRCGASVAWATLEAAPEAGGLRYRAGLEVLDGDVAALASVCVRLTST